jgi:hypothetical protein
MSKNKWCKTTCVCMPVVRQQREREWVMGILGRLLEKIKFRFATLLQWWPKVWNRSLIWVFIVEDNLSGGGHGGSQKCGSGLRRHQQQPNHLLACRDGRHTHTSRARRIRHGCGVADGVPASRASRLWQPAQQNTVLPATPIHFGR